MIVVIIRAENIENTSKIRKNLQQMTKHIHRYRLIGLGYRRMNSVIQIERMQCGKQNAEN